MEAVSDSRQRSVECVINGIRINNPQTMIRIGTQSVVSIWLSNLEDMAEIFLIWIYSLRRLIGEAFPKNIFRVPQRKS
jgi:hypothetical protein